MNQPKQNVGIDGPALMKELGEHIGAMLAKNAACAQRTPEEAQEMAQATANAMTEIFNRDQNVSGLVLASVPYGTPWPGDGGGLASVLMANIDQQTLGALLLSHVPRLARDYGFSLRGRLKIAWRVLLAKPIKAEDVPLIEARKKAP